MVNEQAYQLIYHLHYILDEWLQAGYHLKTTNGANLIRIDQVDRAIQKDCLAPLPPFWSECLQLETKLLLGES